MKEQTWRQWVRLVEREAATRANHPSRLRKGCLAALTGTDTRALSAFVSCLELYSNTDRPDRALHAAALVVGEMQESTRWIARELIPFVLDWGDRERLWPKIQSYTNDSLARSYATELQEEFGVK